MAAPAPIIWTIGHSNRSFEDFLLLLKAQNIQLLADVRRFPGSRRHPQFSGEQLSAALAKERIKYVHLPELGGRRATRPDSPNTVWRNAAFRGYADYMMTEPFRRGLERLLTLAASERTAIMCAEVLWWRCHRALIADCLKATGHLVIHIMGSGKTQEHPFTSAARISNGRLCYAAEATADLPFETRARA
jgi:uncharacterized protein (DUF488 family)